MQIQEWAGSYYEQGYTQEQVEEWMSAFTLDAPAEATAQQVQQTQPTALGCSHDLMAGICLYIGEHQKQCWWFKCSLKWWMSGSSLHGP